MDRQALREAELIAHACLTDLEEMTLDNEHLGAPEAVSRWRSAYSERVRLQALASLLACVCRSERFLVALLQEVG
jgi:hypothetical protein